MTTTRCRTRFSTLLIALFCLLAGSAAAQSLDIGGWILNQTSSTQAYEIPAGTVIQPAGYVIIARNVDRADFESYFGVTLGAEVVYLRSNDSAPMINGDETWFLENAGGSVIDGPTDAIGGTKKSYHRSDPETQAWSAIDTSPSPGWGVEAPDGVLSGVVISEATDANDYAYEYLELYYDATGGSGNQPPVITDVHHLPESPYMGDDLTITATADDSDGLVVEMRCWTRYEGGVFVESTMAPLGGGVFRVDAPAPVGDKEFQYYVVAEDDDGAVSVSPAVAPSDWYAVWIDGPGGGSMVVLFDHAHDQDAGSAGNWRVDDNHPDPYPAAPTSETSWNGQLSSWGFELHQAGHTIRSNTSAITASQLADVDLLIIPEPQNPFTAAEIEAVRQFVFDGGSLFMIGDHNSSDRNNNGWDSPSIFGGYTYPHITTPIGSDTETFAGALFGLHFHVKDEGNNAISGAYDNVISDPTNPVIHGSYGEVTGVYYHVGNVMTLWPTANPHLSDVGGLISKDEGYPHMAAWSRYGEGKVVGYGDSSSMADGTGSESHEDNWSTEASHREFFLNASEWLLARETSAVDGEAPRNPGLDLRAAPNPFNPSTVLRFTMPAPGPATVEVFDLHGRRLKVLLDGPQAAGERTVMWDGRDDRGRAAPSGVYLVRAAGGGRLNYTKVILAK